MNLRTMYKFSPAAVFNDIISNGRGIGVRIRKIIKEIFGVPKNCSNHYLYASRKNGGCGMKSLIAEYAIQLLSHTYNMLTSDNAIISDTPMYSLRATAAGMRLNPNLTLSDALEWFNSE